MRLKNGKNCNEKWPKILTKQYWWWIVDHEFKYFPISIGRGRKRVWRGKETKEGIGKAKLIFFNEYIIHLLLQNVQQLQPNCPTIVITYCKENPLLLINSLRWNLCSIIYQEGSGFVQHSRFSDHQDHHILHIFLSSRSGKRRKCKEILHSFGFQ